MLVEVTYDAKLTVTDVLCVFLANLPKGDSPDDNDLASGSPPCASGCVGTPDILLVVVGYSAEVENN